MKKLTEILEKLISFDLYSSITSNPEDYLIVFEKRFELSDLDISSRVLNHWKDCGLLPDEEDLLETDDIESTIDNKVDPGYKKRNKFDFVGLIYLFILQDLRDFGYPISKLKKIKQALLFRPDMLDSIMQLTELDIQRLKKQGIDTRLAQMLFDNKQEIFDNKEIIPYSIRYSPVLSHIVQAALVSKLDLQLIITKDGDLSVELRNSAGQGESTDYNRQPHIVLPIFKYLSHFLSIDKYKELYVSFKLLDEQELLILNHIRSGKYIKISINLNDKESFKVEVTEKVNFDINARLSEILLKGGYQDIHITTQNGEISYSTTKTKTRI